MITLTPDAIPERFSSSFVESTTDLTISTQLDQTLSSILQEPYVYLSSFPRSGNGWVRLVLAAFALAANGLDINSITIETTSTPAGVKFIRFRHGDDTYDLERIFPDIYILMKTLDSKPTFTRMDVRNIRSRFVKTHHIINCSQNNVVFLFREPVSCITSASLLLNQSQIIKNPQLINDTMLYLCRYYRKMLDHYLKERFCNPDKCLFVCLEDLTTADAARTFQSVLGFAGLNVEQSLISRILDRFPLRSGYNKAISEHISDATIRFIDLNVGGLFSRAKEIAYGEIGRKSEFNSLDALAPD